MKICTKCKLEKPLDLFSKDKKHKSGYYLICKSCACLKVKQYVARNKELVLQRQKYYYYKDLEKSRQKSREYSKNNRAKLTACTRKYRQNNKHKCNAYNATRSASKSLRTPKWLTEEHKEAILKVYERAKDYSYVLGKNFSVDHVVPLHGKTVCGLHVPWNLQILSKSENSSKSNKLIEEPKLRIIKKYSNRKMYCKDVKTYVTLKDIESFIKNDEIVEVYDDKTGKNITGEVLLQVYGNNPENGADLERLIRIIKSDFFQT